MDVIDPHVHLFNLEQGIYDWLKPNTPPYWQDKHIIHKDFEQHDLTLKFPLNLAGFVHIEAGFDNKRPWHEISWLEQHCTLPFRSIAFIDITLDSEAFDKQVDYLKQFSSLVGVRYILDEQAGTLLKQPQVIRNLEIVANFGWLFELHVSLADEQTLHHLINFCSEVKTPSMVLNHAGFPPYFDNLNKWQHWCQHIEQLAQFEHISVKCSGWEMTNRHYDFSWVGSCINQILMHFGVNRTMLASNFPLTLFSHEYYVLWNSYINELEFDSVLLEHICYQNAKRIYHV